MFKCERNRNKSKFEIALPESRQRIMEDLDYQIQLP